VRASPIQFERLLIRLQRRWVLRRLLDGFVLGMAAGSAAAVLEFGAAWWLGAQPLRPVWVIAILAAAGGLGAAFAARRRTSLAQIALQADRALGTDELFLSALFAQSIAAPDADQTNFWAAAVIAEAQRRAAELAPRAVLQTIVGLGIGARARVAVFLLAGAVVTAAASLPAGRVVTPATAASEASTIIAPGASDAADAAGGAVLRVAVAMPPLPVGVAPADDLASRMDAQQNQASPARDASAAGSTSTQVAKADRSGGAGESRTADASAVLPPAVSAAARTAVDRARRAAGGGGTSNDAPAINTPAPGPFSSATAGPPSAITGQRAGPSSVRLIDNPFATIGDGESSPDTDRDLLRDYFSPSVPNIPNGSP